MATATESRREVLSRLFFSPHHPEFDDDLEECIDKAERTIDQSGIPLHTYRRLFAHAWDVRDRTDTRSNNPDTLEEVQKAVATTLNDVYKTERTVEEAINVYHLLRTEGSFPHDTIECIAKGTGLVLYGMSYADVGFDGARALVIQLAEHSSKNDALDLGRAAAWVFEVMKEQRLSTDEVYDRMVPMATGAIRQKGYEMDKKELKPWQVFARVGLWNSYRKTRYEPTALHIAQVLFPGVK